MEAPRCVMRKHTAGYANIVRRINCARAGARAVGRDDEDDALLGNYALQRVRTRRARDSLATMAASFSRKQINTVMQLCCRKRMIGDPQ